LPKPETLYPKPYPLSPFSQLFPAVTIIPFPDATAPIDRADDAFFLIVDEGHSSLSFTVFDCAQNMSFRIKISPIAMTLSLLIDAFFDQVTRTIANLTSHLSGSTIALRFR